MLIYTCPTQVLRLLLIIVFGTLLALFWWSGRRPRPREDRSVQGRRIGVFALGAGHALVGLVIVALGLAALGAAIGAILLARGTDPERPLRLGSRGIVGELAVTVHDVDVAFERSDLMRLDLSVEPRRDERGPSVDSGGLAFAFLLDGGRRVEVARYPCPTMDLGAPVLTPGATASGSVCVARPPGNLGDARLEVRSGDATPVYWRGEG